MKTSQQWWDEVKADQTKLINWLTNQYHGEVTAAHRIVDLFFPLDNRYLYEEKQNLLKIVNEEIIHAHWVAELLISRGVEPKTLSKKERYWESVLKPAAIEEFQSLCAIGHLAESMRLERIKVIVDDKDTPEDIREVFAKILPMELGHAKMFEDMSTIEDIENARTNHDIGRNALGLVV